MRVYRVQSIGRLQLMPCPGSPAVKGFLVCACGRGRFVVEVRRLGKGVYAGASSKECEVVIVVSLRADSE